MYMETVNELRAAEEQLAGEKAAVRTEEIGRAHV